jgi:hypothetical protein
MTLFKLNYIVQLDKTHIINWERAGNFKEAFVAYPKRLFTVIGHRKTDENYENMSARRVGSVSNTESGEPPKTSSKRCYYTHLLQSSSGK